MDDMSGIHSFYQTFSHYTFPGITSFTKQNGDKNWRQDQRFLKKKKGDGRENRLANIFITANISIFYSGTSMYTSQSITTHQNRFKEGMGGNLNPLPAPGKKVTDF